MSLEECQAPLIPISDSSRLAFACQLMSGHGSGVICCATAILAVPVHGRDARGTSK
jgi:hypothetical protein